MMYSEAIELQPDNAVLYCNRAMAYLKQDMPHEALEDAEHSLGLDASEANIKAYWRKAQALFDLGRSQEAEEAADAGLALQRGNQHLNRLRRKAREAIALQQLCGDEWTVRMENGIEKRYSFRPDGSCEIWLFGHYIPATFDLSVEGNPRSMVVRMKPEGVGFGNGPPPPPRPYIFDFRNDDQELWLCTPVGTDELPTEFAGQGFDKLRREPREQAAEEKAMTDEPLDERCGRYICEMNGVMPELPPQLPESPSDQQISQEMLVLEQITQLKRRYGMEVHERALELARDPKKAPGAELALAASQLQRRFVARKILPPPPPAVLEPPPEVPKVPVAEKPKPDGDSRTVVRPKSSVSCLAGLVRMCWPTPA